MGKDRNLNIRLAEEEVRALKAIAELEGLTTSAWVRRLIHLHAHKSGILPSKPRKGKRA